MATAVGDGDGVANRNVVFVDTSLETHLAMILSDSDTVSDFKRKIMLEHRQLFPAIGDIKVECLKVKRKGSFYHLSDSMLVKCAFGAAKGNWFVSVDASPLDQNDGVQQLAPLVHSKTTPLEISPLVNQKVFNFDQLTSDGSCKDILKNVEVDRLCNDKQLDYEPQEKLDNVNTDVSLKKRTRDVHNESSPKEASVKKKRKTKRGKSDVKALEENLVLAHDNDKVNEKGASINNDNTFEHRPEDKDLIDENERTNKGESCSALNQVATVVPSIEVVGSETVGNVAMLVENNIQQEMSIGISQKENDSELVRKPTMEKEHSSLMRTPDCEHDAAGVTATGHMKRSTKHKATEKEVSSTSFIKKLHNTNKDATESSQQDMGPNDQESTGDQINLLKQKPELKLPGRKKGAMGCENTGEGKRRKTKKLFKHSDNLVGDISSTVLASVVDERKTNEVSEKTLVDAKIDDVIMKEVEVSVENMEEKSMKEFADANDVTVTNEENVLPHSESVMNNDNLEKQTEKTVDTTKKKKKTKKAAGRNEDESAKHVDRGVCENVKVSESGLPDTDGKDGDKLLLLASAIDERELNRDSDRTLENMEVISRKEFTDANHVATVTDEDNLVNAQGMLDNSEKQNEKTDDAKKKKRKTKKSGGRNEDELMTKNANGEIYENVKEGDRKDGDKVKEKDAQISYDGLAGKENKNDKSQDLQVELESTKSQSVDNHDHLPEKPSKNVTASEVSNVNNEVDSIDNRKDMKKTKVDSKIENNKVSAGVLKDPNITNMDTFKTPKRTKRIDAQKTNKQQSTSVQTRAKTVESKQVNGSQQVKSLLNKAGTIFRDDNDLVSSTHTPPGKPLSSSSSEESSVSLHSRKTGSHARKRNEGDGKVNEKSQSKSKISIADLVRSSISFKKSKVAVSSRVEDTDDQPVDFVPDTQPI